MKKKGKKVKISTYLPTHTYRCSHQTKELFNCLSILSDGSLQLRAFY
jgi:hypothetical protein